MKMKTNKITMRITGMGNGVKAIYLYHHDVPHIVHIGYDVYNREGMPIDPEWIDQIAMRIQERIDNGEITASNYREVKV